MSTKITPDHLGRAAVVYVRQSTMAQVIGNLESQRRQYDLAGAAEGSGLCIGDGDRRRSRSLGVRQHAASRLRAACRDGLLRRRRRRLLHRGVALGAQRARLASPDRSCVRSPAPWSSIRTAPMIRDSSTIACCSG